jgi:hypothetical protein
MTTTQPTRCRGCNRPLRPARSVAAGRGPVCVRKVRTATAAQAGIHKPQAIEKAAELIELGSITPLRGRRVFTVISSDGTQTYKTAPSGCTCPAGINGRRICYHRVAAQILALAA